MTRPVNGPWLRLYCDLPDNVKLRRQPKDVQLTYLWLLCLHKRGQLIGSNPEDLSWRLRMDATELKQHISLLQRGDLLLEDFTPKGWDERQFQSDSSTERVRQFREKHNETLQKRCVKPLPSALLCSVSESVSVSGNSPKRDAMPPDGWPIESVLSAASNVHVGMIESLAREYFDARSATGWVDRCGRPVARTKAALLSDMRRWKTNDPTIKAERAASLARATGGRVHSKGRE